MAKLTKSQKAKAATRVLPEEDPEFQIAPMIDILLVLLVFFMTIATDQVMQVNKEIVLPVAKNIEKATPTTSATSEVNVNVIWNMDNTGKIEVDNAGQKDITALTEYINSKRAQAEDANIKDFKVVIRADKRSKYQYIRTVMVAIGQAKVPHVTFSAVDKELDNKPAAEPQP